MKPLKTCWKAWIWPETQASGREKIPFPSGLSALLQRRLAKAPVDRPQSMQEVVDVLSGLIKQEQRRAEQGFDEIHPVSTPRSNSETGNPQRREQTFQVLAAAKDFVDRYGKQRKS